MSLKFPGHLIFSFCFNNTSIQKKSDWDADKGPLNEILSAATEAIPAPKAKLLLFLRSEHNKYISLHLGRALGIHGRTLLKHSGD